MTYLRPTFRHPALPRNDLGYSKSDYEGAISTLCAGCGHDSISSAIVQACYELSIEPHRVAKLSGIGCSSKTPTYFLSHSHGFNSVHGRMPSVTTGANMANRDLIYLGVSGDGDSASIGMGQFCHVVRRNLNMVYVVMNNGCYGLTKGQDSATADLGSVSKKGDPNPFQGIDMVTLAIELGATFVGRSFSGDKTQLVPLLKAAMSHPGFAFLDVISPCVTFNNNPGSTKSYQFVRDHLGPSPQVDEVPFQDPILIDYEAGSSAEVSMHDGSWIQLRKLSAGWDPRDRTAALLHVREAQERSDILTGLIYVDPDSRDIHELMGTSIRPLNQLTELELCPGTNVLEQINQGFR